MACLRPLELTESYILNLRKAFLPSSGVPVSYWAYSSRNQLLLILPAQRDGINAVDQSEVPCDVQVA